MRLNILRMLSFQVWSDILIFSFPCTRPSNFLFWSVKFISSLFTRRYYYPITLAIIGVLAGVALAIFIWSDVVSLEPYKMSVVSEVLSQGQITGYYELDGEGDTEYLVLKTYGSEFPAVELYEGREKFVDVLRPHGTWFNNFPSYCMGDYDQDMLIELYLFTISNDSILLNAYEPYGDKRHFIRNLFIDHIEEREGKRDLTLEGNYFQDDNKDGKQELVFLLRAGFSRSPRRLYELDIASQTLIRGENYAGGFHELLPADLDQDGRMEFIIAANALENYPPNDTSKKYNDYSAWFVAFTNDLQDVIIDYEFNESKPYIYCSLLKDNSGEVIILMVSEFSENLLHLFKYSFQGELLARKDIYQERHMRILNKPDNDLENIVLTDMQNLFIYNENLELIDTKKAFGFPCTLEDIFEFKKLTGFQLFQKGHQLILADSVFDIQGRIDLRDHSISKSISVSVVSKENDDSFVFSLSTKLDGDFIIAVEKRRFKHAGVYLNLMIYILFYGLFYLIFRIQFFFFNRRLISEQKIHTLQLQTVQNQLQPHFTFNVLNTIGSLIYKNEKESAYEYLNYFSDMLRSTLMSGNQSDWMIDEEIKFINTYVAMENLRFDNKFDFNLIVSPDIDLSLKVPKLMVQTYVENAVSHGLMHKRSDCKLSVDINSDDSHILIGIEDNGIGRMAAEKLENNHGGYGNEILNNYMEVYNKINKTKFTFMVTDLFAEGGKAGGTKVYLWIPRDYSGNIR